MRSKRMKRHIINFAMFVLGFTLACALLTSLAYGGTINCRYNGVEYTFNTPECFPSLLDQNDAIRAGAVGPRLFAIFFKHGALRSCGMALGSEFGKDNLYPVIASYSIQGENDEFTMRWFAYYDYINPTEVSAEEGRAWLTLHANGKPEVPNDAKPTGI